MAIRGPRLEISVGIFLLLSFASLLVLAFASTNQKWRIGQQSYPLKARFTNLGQLRPQAPVKIGGVVIGHVEKIELDPMKYDAVVTLSIDNTYKDLSADTSAGIYTSGLLGENFIGLAPGGDPDTLKPGEEIVFTQPAVDLIQLVGKYMFSGGGAPNTDKPENDAASSPSSEITP